jgi:hypothetical protein
MKCGLLRRGPILVIALGLFSCQTQRPEKQFTVKDVWVSSPDVHRAEITAIVKSDLKSIESKKIIEFKPPVWLGYKEGSADFRDDFGSLVEYLAEVVLKANIGGDDSRQVIQTSKLSLSDINAMSPWKAIHVWELYEQTLPPPKQESSSVRFGEEPRKQFAPPVSPKKVPGILCVKLLGSPKKNRVDSIEMWIASSDSPYASVFHQR